MEFTGFPWVQRAIRRPNNSNILILVVFGLAEVMPAPLRAVYDFCKTDLDYQACVPLFSDCPVI